MRPAFFATSVPLPMATPMSAALMAGASLTPSPVIATTSPFFLSVSASSTLCSGATRPTTPMLVDSLEPLRFGQRGELGAEDRLARDVELLGDRRSGDDVVARHHPHPDVRRLRVGDGGLRLLARRIDHADEARHLQALDQGEQIAVRVEAGGIEIAKRTGHDPQAPPPHALDVLLGALLERRRPRGCSRRSESAVAARLITAGAAPLTKQRTTSLPDCVLGLVEGGHQLVARVERQRREPRQPLARLVDVHAGLVRQHEQRALGRDRRRPCRRRASRRSR